MGGAFALVDGQCWVAAKKDQTVCIVAFDKCCCRRYDRKI